VSSSQAIRVSPRRLGQGLAVLALLAVSLAARADVALLVEEPIGRFGTWTDMGHAAIWISSACLLPSGEVRFCEEGDGVVFSRSVHQDPFPWLAIRWPAYMYASLQAVGDVREMPARIARGQRQTLWESEYGSIYPGVSLASGMEALGEAYRRRIWVIQVETTPEEDRAVLDRMSDRFDGSKYSLFFRNCSHFAWGILNLYWPGELGLRRPHLLGIRTPSGVSRDLLRFLKRHPEHAYQVRCINALSPRKHRPARTILEAALRDWKYAVPLAIGAAPLYGGMLWFDAAFDNPRLSDKLLAAPSDPFTASLHPLAASEPTALAAEVQREGGDAADSLSEPPLSPAAAMEQ
jgi:hypothetical protein